MPASKFHLGVDLNNQRGINVASPTAGTDAVNKDYADGLVQGMSDLKEPVRAASTANVALASALTNGTVMDGVTLATGDRVLLKNQTAGAENGIYVVVASGAASRSTDADANAEVTRGLATTVLEGTTKGTGGTTANPVTYVLSLATGTTVTLGTTPLTFSPIGSSATVYTAGSGIGLSSNEFTVAAGVGLTAEADGLRADYAILLRKAAANNANATTTDVIHNFGHSDITWSCRLISTGAYEYPDVSRVDDNTTRFTFATAPAAGTYRLVVQG